MNLKDRRYIDTGTSGYTFHTLLSHARRLLISSQLKVLRLGALLGFFFVLMSIIGGIVLILVKLLAPESFAPHGWASMMVTIVMLGGLTLLLLGILLEYTSILVLRAHGSLYSSRSTGPPTRPSPARLSRLSTIKKAPNDRARSAFPRPSLPANHARLEHH